MNIFIPPLGTKLELEEPWTFKLYEEYRNSTFIASLKENGYELGNQLPKAPWIYATTLLGEFRLPTGTKLTVKRIFIRQGSKDYDSVSFHCSFSGICPDLMKSEDIKGRMWAKLADVNKIKAKLV